MEKQVASKITQFLDNIYVEEINFNFFNKNNEILIFFHGYPSEEGDKNSTLAIEASNRLKLPAVVFHYSGLGNSTGQFTFNQSLKDGAKIISLYQNKFNTIHLFGHSWGGFVIISLMEILTLNGKIILASPFIFLPQDNELKSLINHVYAETEHILKNVGLEFTYNELKVLRETQSIFFQERVDKNFKNVLYIQAKNDDEAPLNIAQIFISKLKNKISYVEMDTSHDFADKRSELLNYLVNFISIGS